MLMNVGGARCEARICGVRIQSAKGTRDETKASIELNDST
jgi:hypothetical protein